MGIAGVTALIMCLALLTERKKQITMSSKREAKKTLRSMPNAWAGLIKNRSVLLVSLVQACQYYAYGAVEYFMAGYLPEVVHLDFLSTGIITGSLIAIPIFVKPYMGRISDKVGRRTPIIVGLIVSGLPLLAIPFVSDFLLLLLLSVVYGLGFAAVTAATPALASELVSKENVGAAMGFLGTTMDVGQTIGPIISGLILATSLRYAGLFPSLTIVLLSSCVVFALISLEKRGSNN